jgi:DNA invertase Pin-like site-specific DNA recombinase
MHGHSTPIAVSYIRFSSKDQAKGDSLRRQTEAARAWCERNKVQLDTGLTFRDLGKSAFTGAHRLNPDRNALALFLKLVEERKVPRGSYLVLENLDRLTREHIQPALLLVLNLLQAGVRIVQLSPSEMVFDDKSETMAIMLMIVELSRGHSESKMKAERVGKAWAQRKARAREGDLLLSPNLPAWVEERGGKLRLIPERAAVVKRIFHLAANGYGRKLLARRLNDEGVPPMGTAGHWNGSYVWTILNDRRALGELQPRRVSDRKADGEPIPGYFPAAVTEEEWLAARGAAAERSAKPGRVSKHVNVFAGLVKNALDGSSMVVQAARDGRRGNGGTYRRLVNAAACEGRGGYVTFPFAAFEAAVLTCLREIDPHEILNGDAGPDHTQVLAGQLARVEAKIAELEAELLNGDVAAVAKVLRQQEAVKADLVEKLAAARLKAMHPLSESWGECKSLAEALGSAPDPEDLRLRLRSAIRRIVDSIYLVIVPRGHDRVCGAQVWFKGGKRRRDYLICSRPPRSNGRARQEGGWWSWSLAEAVDTKALDLRKRKDAAGLARVLADIDLDRPAD